MANKQSAAYEYITGSNAGINTSVIELDYNKFTTSTADGIFEWTDALPAYSIGIACILETLKTFNVAIDSFKIGNTTGEDEWTTGAIETDDPTTIGFKSMNMYASTGTSALPGVVGTSAQHVFIYLTHASSYALVTSGRVRVTLIYIATQPS
jgi:hypothetical protein